MLRVLGAVVAAMGLCLIGNGNPLSSPPPAEAGGVWNTLLEIEPAADANSLYLNWLNCGWHYTCYNPSNPGGGPGLDWGTNWGMNTQLRYTAFLFNSWDTSRTVANWVAQDLSSPQACLQVRVRITSSAGGVVGDQYNLHTTRGGTPLYGDIKASKNGYHASFNVGSVYPYPDPYCYSTGPHTHQEFWPGSAVTGDSTNHWYTNPSDELERSGHSEPIYLPLWTVEFHS
jgi:hypothetical protein